MPRPNLKAQRSEEILDAYLACVARFDLDGATQESSARQSFYAAPLNPPDSGCADLKQPQ